MNPCHYNCYCLQEYVFKNSYPPTVYLESEKSRKNAKFEQWGTNVPNLVIAQCSGLRGSLGVDASALVFHKKAPYPVSPTHQPMDFLIPT